MKNGKKGGEFPGWGAEPLTKEALRDQLGRDAFYRKGWDEAVTFLLQHLGLSPEEIEDRKWMLATAVLKNEQGCLLPDSPSLSLSVRLARLAFQKSIHAVLVDRLEEWAE